MPRTQLYADPAGRFVHDVVLESCQRNAGKTALVDTSCDRRLTLRRIRQSSSNRLPAAWSPPDSLPAKSSPSFSPTPGNLLSPIMPRRSPAAFPTLLNPAYREREIRYQLENSGATFLITDAPLIENVNLSGLPACAASITHTPRKARGLRAFRQPAPPLVSQTSPTRPRLSPNHRRPSLLERHHRTAQGRHALALQSGRQCLSDSSAPAPRLLTDDDVMLCFLPLYHIYGLTVGLTLSLALGRTLVLMPRFDAQKLCALLIAGKRHHDAHGPARHQCALPDCGGRHISQEPQSPLDQIRRRSSRSRTRPPPDRPHRHQRRPGIWHDRSFPRHSCGLH